MPAPLVPELYVSDLERSLIFYRGLGFATVYCRPDERFAYLALGSAELMIEEPIGRTWLAGPLDHPFGRGINLQISVTDVVALNERAIAMKARFILALETRDYARASDIVSVRQFVVSDPDGYMLRFSETISVK